MTTVSVALCTYNGERFLKEQLDSIAMQSRAPDEVIIGDDCSSDKTIEIVHQWMKTVPFSVRLIQNEHNLGYEKNFANIMLNATGDIIFPCDQDDVWLPDKLKVMEAYFQNHPEVGVAYCRRSLIDQNGNPISERLTELFSNYHPLDSSYFYADFCKDFPDCAGCMSAIRKSLIDQLFPFPELWAHDTWIFTMAPMYAQMKTLPDVLMLFRRHGNNASALGKEADWANGRDVYYLTSVGQYRAHTPYREDLIQRLSQLPSSPYRDGYLKYLKGQEKHFGNRCKIEDHFWTNLHTLVWEILSGRYFQHKQPLKCMLFDVKEGILNSFKRAQGSGHCPR
ncbi:MAG: glycosyltransferase family 2 protein [Thermoguttaceae bacterium]|nr:glycosyltransferase family 2 protein [Thermoguttaceae bacterium]